MRADDTLVTAIELVNGASILQERLDEVGIAYDQALPMWNLPSPIDDDAGTEAGGAASAGIATA